MHLISKSYYFHTIAFQLLKLYKIAIVNFRWLDLSNNVISMLDLGSMNLLKLRTLILGKKQIYSANNLIEKLPIP
jgi:hypothetical protein